MLGTILIVLLVLFLVGALPRVESQPFLGLRPEWRAGPLARRGCRFAAAGTDLVEHRQCLASQKPSLLKLMAALLRQFPEPRHL